MFEVLISPRECVCRSEIDLKPRAYSHIVRPTAYAMFSAILGTKVRPPRVLHYTEPLRNI
jgi:hypothetical protein